MLVNVLLVAFTSVLVRRGFSSFKRRSPSGYKAAASANESGFLQVAVSNVPRTRPR
jgi:hypothetical protein